MEIGDPRQDDEQHGSGGMSSMRPRSLSGARDEAALTCSHREAPFRLAPCRWATRLACAAHPHGLDRRARLLALTIIAGGLPRYKPAASCEARSAIAGRARSRRMTAPAPYLRRSTSERLK